MIQKIERYGQLRPPGVGQGDVQRLDALSNLGKQASNIVFDIAAPKRAKQGELAGLEAGQLAAEKGESPKVQESLFPTIYGDSFNRAQQSAYLASIDTKAVERLSQIEDEHSTDPEAYKQISGAMLSGLIKDAPAEYRPHLNQSISKYISSGHYRVNNNLKEKGREEAKSQLLGSLDTYNEHALRSARNGDFEAVSDMLLKSELSARAMVDGGFWTKEQADATIKESKKGIYAEENRREILETAETNPLKAAQLFSDLDKQDVPNLFAPDEWESIKDGIRSDLSRMMPEKASKEEANDWLKNAKESLQYGFKLSDGDKAEGMRLIYGSGKEAEFNRLMKVEQFSLMSSEDRGSILTKLSGAGSIDSQQDYIELSIIDNKLRKMAEDDAMTLAKKQGLLVPAPIIDGDTSKREEQRALISKRYGIDAGLYMEPEIQDLVNSIKIMSPSEKASLAVSLKGDDNTFKQLDKKNASVFAMVSAIGDEAIANDVFVGEELIKNKQFKMPKKEEYLLSADEYLGRVGEVYQSNDRSTIVKAAMNHYAASNAGDEFDSDLFQKSLEAITGGVSEINGKKVELPKGVSADELEDFVERLTIADIEKFGGLKLPFSNEELKDSRLVSLGGGSYHLEILALQKGKGMEYMKQYNKQGKPLVLTITPDLILSKTLDRQLKYKEKKQKLEEDIQTQMLNRP